MNVARGQRKVQTLRCASEDSPLPGCANGAVFGRAFTRAVIGFVGRRAKRQIAEAQARTWSAHAAPPQHCRCARAPSFGLTDSLMAGLGNSSHTKQPHTRRKQYPRRRHVRRALLNHTQAASAVRANVDLDPADPLMKASASSCACALAARMASSRRACPKRFVFAHGSAARSGRRV
jgi:hypothetical protein